MFEFTPRLHILFTMCLSLHQHHTAFIILYNTEISQFKSSKFVQLLKILGFVCLFFRFWHFSKHFRINVQNKCIDIFNRTFGVLIAIILGPYINLRIIEILRVLSLLIIHVHVDVSSFFRIHTMFYKTIKLSVNKNILLLIFKFYDFICSFWLGFPIKILKSVESKHTFLVSQSQEHIFSFYILQACCQFSENQIYLCFRVSHLT